MNLKNLKIVIEKGFLSARTIVNDSLDKEHFLHSDNHLVKIFN